MRAGRTLWKALPAPVRELAHRTVQGASRALIPLWVALAWRRGRAATLAEGATVVGLFRSSIGLGQGARLFADALNTLDIPETRVDATGWINIDADLPAPAAAPPARPSPRLAVSHLNPVELERALELSRASFLKGRRHVGYWVWELPTPPPRWRRAFDYVDQVWTPSRFSAQALRRIAPAETPVHVVPHPLWAWPTPAPDRAALGLPADRTLVLVAFDLKSTAARKNPDGALDAWLRIPARARGSTTLVCKVSGRGAAPEAFAALQVRCRPHRDVLLLDRTLSSAEMAVLTASVDIVFSPHRAEGFGLLLAEGMRLGKAVVATGWSGNMDFMDASCAALLDYRLTPVVDPQGMYADASWAEPDLDHAAAVLERLIEVRDARLALGGAARARGGPVFDRAAWGALLEDRLGSGLTVRARR